MVVKAVIFDLHGTIVEYKVNSKAARAEVTEYLISQGILPSFFSPSESYFEALNKLEEYLRDRPIEGKTYHQLRDAVFNILDRYELENIASTRLTPGMLDTLKTLKKRGLKLGLLTVNGQKATDRLLSKFRLNGYFQAVITRESAPRLKPHPLHLEILLRLLEVSPQEAVVVGDSIFRHKGSPCTESLGCERPRRHRAKGGINSRWSRLLKQFTRRLGRSDRETELTAKPQALIH